MIVDCKLLETTDYESSKTKPKYRNDNFECFFCVLYWNIREFIRTSIRLSVRDYFLILFFVVNHISVKTKTTL